jgi:tetratricopeptide (TPR) repeat protein
MLTPSITDFEGLGMFLEKKKEEVYFGHGGWDEGFSSKMIAHNDKEYGVVILINANQPDFISELMRSVALSYDWDEYVPTYQKKTLDPDEIANISGRYRLNSDRLVQIYQADNLLYSKKSGEDPVELFKVSDSTYISRTDVRPIQFKANLENEKRDMLLLNADHGSIESTCPLMQDDEKLPMELLESGDFEQAFNAYQAIMKGNPNDPAIVERNLNGLGYRLMNDKKLKLAQDIFKINTLLYPNSSNVYDSYAEACMTIGDLDLAIINYTQALALDPKNKHAEETIKELQKRKVN